MQVPEILCGDARTVAAACRRHVTRFLQGKSWIDLGPLAETKSLPGLVMLEGPSPLLSGANVRLYAPFRELDSLFVRQRVTLEQCVAAFDEAVSTPWGVLSFLSPICYNVLNDEGRSRRFLAATVGYWGELDSVGPRYSRGGPEGKRLWEVAHVLKVVLADRGVAKAQLSQPLPKDGIAAILPSKN